MGVYTRTVSTNTLVDALWEGDPSIISPPAEMSATTDRNSPQTGEATIPLNDPVLLTAARIGGEAALEELVFQSLGRVSVCWSEIPRGIFDDRAAVAIGHKIMDAIHAHVALVLAEQESITVAAFGLKATS